MNLKRVWRWYLLALVLFVLDQLTKVWASAALSYATPIEITSFFNLTLLHNTGAAFSFLSSAGGWQRWLFTGLAIGVSILLCVWLARLSAEKRMESAALALILGGAVGNLLDRIVYGYVVDFLDFHWAGYHWPAFNVADSAICVGAALLILDSLGVGKATRKHQNEM